MINKANSGHPGMALGSAPILYTLFTKHLNATPLDSKWINRDRFILSAGHASSLLYTILHLCGYKISLDDLKKFRQLGSITPGHPEITITDGIDATSGPLGQGIAQAVGMAVAEAFLASSFKDGETLFNHYTYALCGDGCLQEGISQEAISFAGHQHLNKLIVLYDSNNVTLDGGLELSFSENVRERFKASNWNVLEVNDGNDVNAIDDAINKAKQSTDKPTLIIVNTVIGFGSSKQGTSKVHGSPLGLEDGKSAKLSYGLDADDFYIPEEVKQHFADTFSKRGNEKYNQYLASLEEYKEKYPEEFSKYIDALAGKFVDENAYTTSNFTRQDKSTRITSGLMLNEMSKLIPTLIGGSADVAGSVMTKLDCPNDFSLNNRSGKNINFGIREFAMASIQNGMLLHGGVKTYVGCFCVFADYMKPAIRMASLSEIPAIYLFSHDSIAVGEDGPTHQPIEQIAMLRSIPNVKVIRPCDDVETRAAWIEALISTKTPTALILSRQTLPSIATSSFEGVKRGAYKINNVINPDLEIIATGSEVQLALNVAKLLENKNLKISVISMPCQESFDLQSEEYKYNVLTLPKSKRISLEMLSTFGWQKYAEHNIGIDEFGRSAKMDDVINSFGFTAESIAEKILDIIK